MNLRPRDLTESVAAVVLANMTAVMTYVALSVAMTDIARALSMDAAEELWLPDAFLLALVCATPLSAYLMRRLGIANTMTVCLTGIAVASGLSFFTNSAPLLLSLLFVQGLACAPIPPATQALVAGVFPPQRRNVGMAIWSGGTMVGVSLGSFLGGYLSGNFGWPWIFLICIPPAVVALPLARAAARRHAAENDEPEPHHRTDGLGMILLVATLLAASIAINLIADLAHERMALVAGLLLVAAITGTFFAVNYRRTDDPILDLGTLRDRPLAIAALLNLVVAMFSTGIIEAEMLGTVIGYGAQTLGVLATIRGVALLAGTIVGAAILWRGNYVLGTVAGLVALSAGKFGTTVWAPGLSVFDAAWPGALSSLGYGMLATVLAVVAFATISASSRPAAASVFVFGAVFGSAVGVAVLDAVRAIVERSLVAQGTAQDAATVSSYIAIMWIQLVATLALLPLPFLLRRSAQRSTKGISP